MKLLITALFVGIAHASWALPLDVKVTQSEIPDQFEISYSTEEQFTAMCHLKATSLQIDQVVSSEESSVGEVRINVERDVMSPCLMAHGPDRGATSFQVGWALPSLLGNYRLLINDDLYGTLSVTGGVIELIKAK